MIAAGAVPCHRRGAASSWRRIVGSRHSRSAASSSWRLATPSLSKACWRWFSTVRSDRSSRVGDLPVGEPPAASVATSRSRPSAWRARAPDAAWASGLPRTARSGGGPTRRIPRRGAGVPRGDRRRRRRGRPRRRRGPRRGRRIGAPLPSSSRPEPDTRASAWSTSTGISCPPIRLRQLVESVSLGAGFAEADEVVAEQRLVDEQSRLGGALGAAAERVDRRRPLADGRQCPASAALDEAQLVQLDGVEGQRWRVRRRRHSLAPESDAHAGGEGDCRRAPSATPPRRSTGESRAAASSKWRRAEMSRPRWTATSPFSKAKVAWRSVSWAATAAS